MISSIAVRNYLTVLSERGLSATAILDKSQVDAIRLGDPEYMLETAQYRTIVANIVKLTGDDGIGFDLGTRTDIASLGVVGHTALTCKTVRDTHKLWSRFGAVLVGIMGRLDVIDEDEASVLLAIGSPDPLDPLFRFSVEEMLGLVQMIGKPLVGHSPLALEITLSYPTPVHQEKYRQLFDCPIHFSARRTTVRLPRPWFDRPIQTHDNEFNTICLHHCESLYSRIEHAKPMTLALRSVFSRNADRPLPSLEEAARTLNLTPRTLRRRLHAEETSFRHEMDIYRAEQAKKLFSYGTVSSKEAAFLLGFKEQSAFRHAFKGWTGQTISEYRSATVVSLTSVPSVVGGRKKETSKSFFRRRTGNGHISI